VAKQRLDDGKQILEQLSLTVAAVYLAGYSVECILKALIIDSIPQARRRDMVDSFKGAKAHDFEWLKFRYQEATGRRFPKEVSTHFRRVSTWSTDFRYRAGTIKRADADAFLTAVEAIVNWVDGRL
jgi:hypothetical protein